MLEAANTSNFYIYTSSLKSSRTAKNFQKIPDTHQHTEAQPPQRPRPLAGPPGHQRDRRRGSGEGDLPRRSGEEEEIRRRRRNAREAMFNFSPATVHARRGREEERDAEDEAGAPEKKAARRLRDLRASVPTGARQDQQQSVESQENFGVV